jgi:hypothetical protein
MSKSGLIAGIVAAAAVVTVAGVAISQKKPTTSTTTPPPSSNYTLNLTGPSSAQTGVSVSYSVTLENSGTPVPNVSVSLYLNGSAYPATTNSSGVASYSVEFSSSGTATLYAEYNGVKGNTLSVNVSTSSTTFTLKLSGPTNVTTGSSATYVATLDENGSPFASADVTLYLESQSYGTKQTNSSGQASFTLNFASAGTAVLYTTYTEKSGTVIQSNQITVTTGTSSSGQCTNNAGCSAESNCINGVCTPLEATDISIASSVDITGYLEVIFQSYDLVPKANKYLAQSGFVTACPSSIVGNSGLMVFSVKVTGKVLSGTVGINQAPITIDSVTGGSAWSGPHSSSGTVALDVSYGSANSSGVFTLDLQLEMRVSVAPNVSLPISGVVFNPESVDVPIFTVKISSMGLTKEVIVSPNILMYALHCLYGGL